MDDLEPCPGCGKEIEADALRCPFCRYNLIDGKPADDVPVAKPMTQPTMPKLERPALAQRPQKTQIVVPDNDPTPTIPEKGRREESVSRPVNNRPIIGIPLSPFMQEVAREKEEREKAFEQLVKARATFRMECRMMFEELTKTVVNPNPQTKDEIIAFAVVWVKCFGDHPLNFFSSRWTRKKPIELALLTDEVYQAILVPTYAARKEFGERWNRHPGVPDMWKMKEEEIVGTIEAWKTRKNLFPPEYDNFNGAPLSWLQRLPSEEYVPPPIASGY